jgi:hypothetical protein
MMEAGVTDRLTRAHSELRRNLPKTGDSLFDPGYWNAEAVLEVLEGNGLYECATAYRQARSPVEP